MNSTSGSLVVTGFLVEFQDSKNRAALSNNPNLFLFRMTLLRGSGILRLGG